MAAARRPAVLPRRAIRRRVVGWRTDDSVDSSVFARRLCGGTAGAAPMSPGGAHYEHTLALDRPCGGPDGRCRRGGESSSRAHTLGGDGMRPLPAA